MTARRMGGANGSRECAPDDELRDTHRAAMFACGGVIAARRNIEGESPHLRGGTYSLAEVERILATVGGGW
jgi:hypothetical protein